MSLDLSTLFILGSSYLLLLFGVAYITDRADLCCYDIIKKISSRAKK